MASLTRRGLEDFDNQHDFERMAADILNALGYSDVEPMAPAGGPDQGRDIVFKEGNALGIALVTLDKNIGDKFKRDLAKQRDGEGLIFLFCNVDVSPSMKFSFAKEAIAKGYRIHVFDLERLRSLLDSSLKAVRRRYLNIDEVALGGSKTFTFSRRRPISSRSPTLAESLLTDSLPRRLFDLLMLYDEEVVVGVPGVGGALHDHLKTYYEFRQFALQAERDLLSRIGQMVKVQFQQGWRIFLKYAWLRFGRMSQEDIVKGGNFLNFDITWGEAERFSSRYRPTRKFAQWCRISFRCTRA